MVVLENHKQQQAFREQFGPDYCSTQDLVFSNPDGSQLRPNSISASISALFKRLKIPKPKRAGRDDEAARKWDEFQQKAAVERVPAHCP